MLIASSCFALQHKLLSSHDGSGLPSKRTKLSLQDQLVEDVACDSAPCQSSTGEYRGMNH